MSAAHIDVVIEQGSRWNPMFTWKDGDGDPVDLTGWSGKMEIREEKDRNSDLIHRVETSDGSMSLGGENGTIKPDITATETGGFTFEWGWYDIELTPPSGDANTIRVVQGKARLDKSVTD